MSRLKVFLYLITLIFVSVQLTFLIKIWLKLSEVESSKYLRTVLLDLQQLKFNKYLTDFNKSYTDHEYRMRFKNFKVSLTEIAKLNAYKQDAKFGLTQFSDMSLKEFADFTLNVPKSYCLNMTADKCPLKSPIHIFELLNLNMFNSEILDKKIDWREKGIIGPIMDQKRCGGCWAFSVAGVMEAMAKKNNLTKEALSIQQILDCIPDPPHYGCQGGSAYTTLLNLCAFNWAITTERNYPLTLKDERCQVDPVKVSGIKIKRFNHACNINDDDLQRALLNGPVIAIVNAATWRNYLGGIIQSACVRSDDSMFHAIQVVGYDKTGDIPFYIVKNSWGELFGDHGYVKLEMFKNMCGISEDVSMLEVERILK